MAETKEEYYHRVGQVFVALVAALATLLVVSVVVGQLCIPDPEHYEFWEDHGR